MRQLIKLIIVTYLLFFLNDINAQNCTYEQDFSNEGALSYNTDVYGTGVDISTANPVLSDGSTFSFSVGDGYIVQTTSGEDYSSDGDGYFMLLAGDDNCLRLNLGALSDTCSYTISFDVAAWNPNGTASFNSAFSIDMYDGSTTYVYGSTGPVGCLGYNTWYQDSGDNVPCSNSATGYTGYFNDGGFSDLSNGAFGNLSAGNTLNWQSITYTITDPKVGFNLYISKLDGDVTTGIVMDNVCVTANSCSEPATIVVEASSNGPVCPGADVTLNETAGEASSWVWTGPSGFSSAIQSPTVSPAVAGWYYVTGTDDLGTFATDSVEVNLNDTPVISASVKAPALCSGDNVLLAEAGGDAISWSWTGPGNFNSSLASPTVTNAVAGNYTVTITDANACQTSQTVAVSFGGTCCPDLFQNPVSGLNTMIDHTSNNVTFSWDAYPNATLCLLSGQKVSAPVDVLIYLGNGVDPAPNSRTFPLSMFDSGIDYKWRITCGCSTVAYSPLTNYEVFNINISNP